MGKRRPRVAWEGQFFQTHSLAHVNRAIGSRLVRGGAVDLAAVSDEQPDPVVVADEPHSRLRARLRAEVPRRCDVVVRHGWPPDFDRPDAGAFVVMQPWEYGGLPDWWVEPLRTDAVDEVWCYSSYVEDCYRASGVPEEKLVRVPLAVDLARFGPEGPSYDLPTDATTTFLFVGGALPRKGIDVIFDAYTTAFEPDDDVCLVVKASHTQTLYKGSGIGDQIEELRRCRSIADVVYIDDDLAAADVAALYRSCTALVHPYRGEGFGLPIAEAMASGLPVVVTAAGPCLDYCDDESAYLVPAERVPFLGPDELPPSTAGYWVFEPDRSAVVDAMRAVVEDPETARRKGAAAHEQVVARLSWDTTADIVTRRIEALAAPRASTPAPTSAPDEPERSDPMIPAREDDRRTDPAPQVPVRSLPASPPGPVISYAQNGEDIVLWRALRGRAPGIWVDVGAGHPVADSVTKFFSERGWTGVNVEPNPEMFALIEADRPSEANLNVGLAETQGHLTFYRRPGNEWGLSTFDPDIVAAACAEGSEFEEVVVPVLTLSRVLEEFAAGEVDFLKIDVEGFERQVLAGGDLARHRPKVIVIESTRPQSMQRCDAEWSHIITEAGYTPTLFDGVNVFYVHEAAAELRPSLSVPANVLDDFVPHRFAVEIGQANQRAGQAERLATRAGELLRVARDADATAPPAAADADVPDVPEARALDGCRSVAVLYAPSPDAADREAALGAWFRTFGAADDVTLVLWLPSDGDRPLDAWLDEFTAIAARHAADAGMPDVLVVEDPSGEVEATRLLLATTAVLCPTGALADFVEGLDGAVVVPADSEALRALTAPVA